MPITARTWRGSFWPGQKSQLDSVSPSDALRLRLSWNIWAAASRALESASVRSLDGVDESMLYQRQRSVDRKRLC